METSFDDVVDAIRLAGGPTAVASKLGIGQSAVSNWIARGRVPEEQCAALEILTGIPCERIRPDLLWQRDLTGRVIGHLVVVSPTVEQEPSTVEAANAERGEA